MCFKTFQLKYSVRVSLFLYLRLLAFVSGFLSGRRTRLLSQSLETTVEILQPTFTVAQVFSPLVFVLGDFRRFGWILIVFAITVFFYGIDGLQYLRSSEKTVAPSQRRIFARRLNRVGHGTNHSYVSNIRTKPAEKEIERQFTKLNTRTYIKIAKSKKRYLFFVCSRLFSILFYTFI